MGYTTERRFLSVSDYAMAEKRCMTRRPYRIVLLGASVGQAWNLPAFPERAKDADYALESLAVWQFDKSDALDEILMRPKRKFRLTWSYLRSLFRPPLPTPDAIIVKECSAYFPGESTLSQKQSLVMTWVEQISHSGIKPVLATVVPVTRARSGQDKAKMKGIREFNDWIRNYARDRRLSLLDLEAALRTDPVERYLRDDLTSGDGSHLNDKAYETLDKLLHESLAGIKNGGDERRIVKK